MPRRVVAAGAAVAACLVLVGVTWVAMTGVGPLASGERPVHFSYPSASVSAASPQPTVPTPSPDAVVPGGPDLTWIGRALEILVLLGMVAVVIGTLVLVIPRRVIWRRRERGPARIDFEEPLIASKLQEEISSVREVQLTRLYEGTPRNGIIESWIAFEQAATAVGLPPRLPETPTEFLTRLLERLRLDPHPGVRLAQLYHVARFSSHPLDEDDREAARRALLELHAQLQGRRSDDVSGVRS